MANNSKEARLKTQKKKNSGKTGLNHTRQENITKLKNLLTYDSEVQMYAQAYSEQRLAN